MISLIYGGEKYLVQEEINKIIADYKDEIIRFDQNDKDFLYDDFINAYSSVGLFSFNKLILYKDPEFLIKKTEFSQLAEIIEYCKNPVYEIDIVFYTFDNLFNEKLNTFKDICTNASKRKFDQINKKDFFNYSVSLLAKNNISLTRDLQTILIEKCNNSLTLLNENIVILSLYPGKIDKEVLLSLIIESNEYNVFNLINALCQKRLSVAMSLVDKLYKNNDNVFGFISLLASQLRFLYEVNYYKNLNYSISKIMDCTNVKNSYRIEKAIENLNNLNDKKILKLLEELSMLDYKMKTNYELNDKLQLELFVIEACQ